MQISKLLLVSIPFIVSACTTVPNEPTIEIKTVTVEVPIPVACKSPLPKPPVYCFKELRESNDIFIKTRCLLSDRKKSLAYEIELVATVNSCK